MVSAVPVAGVFHSLFGGDVHVRWERLVHKCAKAHAEVAGGAVHGLSQAFTQRPQAEEVVIHGVGEIHEIVEIHRIVFHLTHLHREAFGIIWVVGCRDLKHHQQVTGSHFHTQHLYQTRTPTQGWASPPGLRLMCSLWGLIWVMSCVATVALLLRVLSSTTCSLLVGDSTADGAQPAATRLRFRSQRGELVTPRPKSWMQTEHSYRNGIPFRDLRSWN